MSKEKEYTAERKLFEYVAYIGLDYKEIREKMESGGLAGDGVGCDHRDHIFHFTI